MEKIALMSFSIIRKCFCFNFSSFTLLFSAWVTKLTVAIKLQVDLAVSMRVTLQRSE